MTSAAKIALLGLVGAIVLVGMACDSSGNQMGGGDPENAIVDTRLMQRAQSAANDLIRNASDCEAVRSAYSEVIAALDEVQSSITTKTGRTSLDALRKQVEVAGNACGAR